MEFNASYSYDMATLSPGQWAIVGIISVILLIAQWKLFTKAGQPGWAVLIPIYNLVVMYRIVCGRGTAWLRLLIPFYNIYWEIKTFICLAHAFGKSTGFGWLMFFFAPICYLILGFDSSEYVGPQDM